MRLKSIYKIYIIILSYCNTNVSIINKGVTEVKEPCKTSMMEHFAKIVNSF